MVKCRPNVNFKEILSVQKEKIMDFVYCEEYVKEYIKQNIIMAVLRKANSHSVVIYRLTKENQ